MLKAYPRSHGATDMAPTVLMRKMGLSPLARGNRAGPGSGVQLLVNFLQLLPGGGQVATGHKVSVFAAQGGHGGGVAGRGCLIIDSCLRLIGLRLRCIFRRLRNGVSGCSYYF